MAGQEGTPKGNLPRPRHCRPWRLLLRYLTSCRSPGVRGLPWRNTMCVPWRAAGCLGTIEPRKNHLLLLHAWRALAERAPAVSHPRLVLVGRRGWENENVVDLLDRCEALTGLVIEAGRVGDVRLAELLAGARAVLMPSFAEGFGLPVAEALAAGVPVIASDIAVLRETGGTVPDYLDPLDGPGWLRAIADHARPDSPMRAAQLARMQGWQAPGWDAHFAQVLPFLDAL